MLDFRRIKVFDWVAKFGIIAFVVLFGASSTVGQGKPGDKKRGDKSKVVTESTSEDDEDGGVIEIVVKIPKPEALIFSRRMKTRYHSIGYEKSFTDKIIDSAKHSPF